jgi:hypothetical protein
MQVIMYAGGEFLTGDEIADALLEYSCALGEEDRAQLVQIPIREPDGTQTTARFLVGPASQIVAKAVSGDAEELVDEEVVARLRTLSRGSAFPRRPRSMSNSHGGQSCTTTTTCRSLPPPRQGSSHKDPVLRRSCATPTCCGALIVTASGAI